MTAILLIMLVSLKQIILHKTDIACCSRISLQHMTLKALPPTLLQPKALA